MDGFFLFHWIYFIKTNEIQLLSVAKTGYRVAVAANFLIMARSSLRSLSFRLVE